MIYYNFHNFRLLELKFHSTRRASLPANVDLVSYRKYQCLVERQAVGDSHLCLPFVTSRRTYILFENLWCISFKVSANEENLKNVNSFVRRIYKSYRHLNNAARNPHFCNNATTSTRFCNNATIDTRFCNNATINTRFCNNATFDTRFCNNATTDTRFCNNATLDTRLWNNTMIDTSFCNNVTSFTCVQHILQSTPPLMPPASSYLHIAKLVGT